MPADIVIAFKEGGSMELESEDGATIADIFSIHGHGYLKREDGVTKVNPNIPIRAGRYSWIPAQQSESKKRKLDFELNNSTSNERVLEFFSDRAKQSYKKEDSRDACYPFMVQKTWNREHLNRLFREKQEIVLKNILNWDDDRAPLVIAVVAGYGNGKTHFLQIAPDLVKQESLFITFNREQCLKSDISQTREALIVRIIFQSYGTGSCGAANYITSNEGMKVLSTFSCEKLLEVATERLVQKFGSTTSFMICVDEVRKVERLHPGATSEMLSTLGALARNVYDSTLKLKCTAVITALDKEGINLYSSSQRAVEYLQLPTPDLSAVELIAEQQSLPQDLAWKVVAVAGSHFRSIVSSVNVLNEGNSHVNIESLVNLTYKRLKNTIDEDCAIEIEQYTRQMMEKGDLIVQPTSVKLLCSIDAAVPPPLIHAAYKTRNNLRLKKADKRTLAIFHNDIENDSFDQLELSAMNYDLLRSVWELHVIPTSMHATNGSHWYKDLKFPPALDITNEGILKMEGQKQKIAQWSGLIPKVGIYYHPGLSNHPWIDRFFVAETSEGRKCLVLYQDKINTIGFSSAVEDLNNAANLLKHNLEMDVLCIANVIGASSRTRKQYDFRHPYLLIRESELDQFYTPNFAPAMRFLRNRFHNCKKYKAVAASLQPIANGSGNNNGTTNVS